MQPYPMVRPLMLCVCAGMALSSSALATDRTKRPEGTNHQAAHARATGAGVTVGIIDLEGFRTSEEFANFNGGIIDQDVANPNAPLPGEPATVKGHTLGNRFKGNFSYSGRVPRTGGSDYTIRFAGLPIANGTDRHPTLTANIAAGGDWTIKANPPRFPAQRDFLGVAKASNVYFGGVGNAFTDLQSAVDDMHRIKGARILNYSVSEGAVGSDNARRGGANGADQSALFLDWYIESRDIVFVKSAGNLGGGIMDGEDPRNLGGGANKISKPGDFYNGITVGSVDFDENTGKWRSRSGFSSYWLGTDNGTMPDVRGKPDVVAPGQQMWDGKTYQFTGGASGTSFAAPHVTGIASLLMQRGGAAGRQHEAIKAIILNSARKRFVNGANPGNASALDNAGSGNQASDLNYLAGAGFANPNNAVQGVDWTPTQWNFAGGKFTATLPLDDELGTGVADAARALDQLDAGEHAAGRVPLVGWSRGSFGAPNGDNPPNVSSIDYALDRQLTAGTFLTATLCWDRLVQETDANRPGDPDFQPPIPASEAGLVDEGDTYSFKAMANLDLLILRRDPANPNAFIEYAESISVVDNVEHLHIPITAAGDYTIRVRWTNAEGAVGATPFALAWHTVPAPGAAALAGLALLTTARRRRG
ncbi:MAG: S8 family serine peptidase [Planctomycetota bacterium]|nr:S8 family serine peptidase [Planctomycetota bacterium]